jgi:hypothetical protein
VGVVYFDRDTNRGSRALVLHYDGRRWSDLSPPDASEDRFLTGVTARGPYDVWASGATWTGGAQHTLLLHYDRAGWHTVRTPSPGAGNTLYDVTRAGGQLWAVGSTAADFRSLEATLALRRH